MEQDKVENTSSIRMILLYFFGLGLLYLGAFFPVVEGVTYDEINRGIDPPFRNVLNGWLGSLFYLKYLGVLIWFMVPSLIILSFRGKIPMKKYHLLWAFPIVILFVFVAVKANINYRYHLTLFPLFTVISFWSVSKLFEGGKYQQSIFYGILSLQVFNSLLFFGVDFYPRYKHRLTEKSSDAIKVENVFSHINQHLGSNDKVFVDNLPEFFVKTNKKGVFAWSGSKIYFDVHGIHNFPTDIGPSSLRRMLADTMHCNYFLVNEKLRFYRGGYQDFLNEQTSVTFADSSGYRLHKLIAEK